MKPDRFLHLAPQQGCVRRCGMGRRPAAASTHRHLVRVRVRGLRAVARDFPHRSR